MPKYKKEVLGFEPRGYRVAADCLTGFGDTSSFLTPLRSAKTWENNASGVLLRKPHEELILHIYNDLLSLVNIKNALGRI